MSFVHTRDLNSWTQVLDTSHWPQLEQPEAFNAALRNWLKKLPPVGLVDYTSEAAEERVGKATEEEHRHPSGTGKFAEGKIVDLEEKLREKAHEEL